MKIAISTKPLNSNHAYRGVGVYTRNLVAALEKYEPQHKYLLTDDPYGSSEADLVHYPYFDLFFLTLPLFKKLPTIVTIHDVIPLLYPSHYRPGLRGALKFLFQKASLNGARAIVTDSERSRVDIIKYLSVPDNRVKIVYLAAAEGFGVSESKYIEHIMKKFEIMMPYVLYVGDINYNKNIARLIEAFSKINEQLNLVLVSRAMGNRIEEAKEIHRLIKALSLTERVRILTEVETGTIDDLRGLYSGALCYVQPSLYEGFGLPVLEAIACKTLPVVSVGGSLPEVTPPLQITFDPTSVDSMAKAMTRAISLSAQERERLIEVAYQFGSQFTWQKTVHEMVAIYERVLDRS
jgi:glycosyltransferase involved in cell wall biosynthesis